MGDVGSNHAEGGFDFLCCGMLGALDGAALAGGDMDLAVVHLDGGEVGGGLDEVLYLAAHGQHTVGTGVKRVEEVVLGLAVDKAGGFGNGLEGDLEVGLGAAEFEADVLGKVGNHLFESLLVVVCHDDVGPSLAGDGVAQVAAVDAGKAYQVLLGGVPEDAVEELDGAAAATVDVVAAVAACQAGHLDAVGAFACGNGAGGVVDGHGGVDASGTADAVLAFVLVVEVEEDVALEPVGAEVGGTGEAGFFVDGEKAFEGTVLDAVVGQDGHGSSHADAVVGAEGGAVAYQPAVLDVGLNGLGEEVEVFVAVFLAHHVHVGLETNAGGVLVSW